MSQNQENTSATYDEVGDLVSIDVKHTPITQEDFKKLNISQLGLDASDYDSVVKIAQEININDANSINLFGQTLGTQTSHCTDTLLDMVKAKDTDVAGMQLTKILVLAQNHNSQGIGKSKYKDIPIIGGLLSKIATSSRGISNNLHTTKESLNQIMKEIEESQKGLTDRIAALENMFSDVTQEYHQLGVYVASGKLVVEQITHTINNLNKGDLSNQLTVQKINDLSHMRSRLEKRVSDLHILQQSAIQTLPQIRIIQNNNSMLIDKFHSIRTVTLPAWKNQISLTLSLKEQQGSVRLTQEIDNATNDLLKSNADLLKQNSIETARSNQRAVIDIATLEHVQQTLIETVTQTQQIQAEGQRQREESYKKLTSLQAQMNKQITDTSSTTPQVGSGR